MAAKTKPLPADVVERQAQYKDLGLTNPTDYKTIPELEKALIENVYKLSPAIYAPKGTKPPGKGVAYNVAQATADYQFEQPKLSDLGKLEAGSFTKAVDNYTKAIRKVQELGAENVNKKDLKTLDLLARQVRDFDSPSLSENAKQIITNIGDVVDAINSINNQRESVETQRLRSLSLRADGTKLGLNKKEKEAARNLLTTKEDELTRLINTANQSAPKLEESLTRFGLSDIARGIGAPIARAKQVDAGLEALRGDRIFQTGGLAGRLNVQVTDDQIINDINAARKAEAKSLYDIGTAAVTDLQSQLTQANQFLADLPEGDRRRIETQKSIDGITTQLAEAQRDTLEAQKLYEQGQPISGTQATDAISKFRESLRLPEERTLAQIETIDPTIGATVRALSKQYQTMAETPLGPTTTQQTEDLRNQIEQEALNQLRLGSTLGAEERRGYEQAARAAQTARGNVLGLGPAVQEAASIGAAGEQRKLARYGAAAAFLGSGETTGAATARDLGLRNALEQSRLGAAQGFVAGGPTMYNLASQRLGTQQGILNNYLAASAPQATGGFQATPSAANPYAYVNPNAGFMGAQNAAGIYNTLADYQARTYGAQTAAQAATYRSFGQEFGSIAGGVGSLMSGAGSLSTAGVLCWVAREVYGIDNPKWLQFREWMLTKASDNLRNFYIEYGARIAESIRNKPKIKAVIRKWMDSKIG